MTEKEEHISVLKNQILEQFKYLSKIKNEGYFFDGTLGAAGHSIAIAKNTGKNIKFIGVDLDQNALEIAKNKVEKNKLTDRFTFIQGNFKEVKDILDEAGIENIVGALVDLGVSSMQFDQPERGFSFKYPDEALDMRMNLEQNITARYVVNNYNSSTLEHIFRDFGEERFAHRITKEIVQNRKKKKIETVGDLLEILAIAIPRKFQQGKIHFATKVFQALRIEVNGELSKLDEAVFDITDKLMPGGKLAIITFHSLEDRIIKNTFVKLQNPCECPSYMPCVCGKKATAKILTKKPLIPSEEEIKDNPRSRSSKLRVIEKI